MVAIILVFCSPHVRGRIEQTPVEVSIDLPKTRKAVESVGNLPKGTLALPPRGTHNY